MSDSAPLKVTLARVAGLVFVLIGCAALTSGYLGWRDDSTHPQVQPITHSAPTAKSPRIIITRSSKPTRQTTRSRTIAPAHRITRSAASHPPRVETAKAAPVPAPASWRRTLVWSGAVLLLGLALVGYSLHERPKIVRSGADEMLNEPTPF
jgi:hypothetical protein